MNKKLILVLIALCFLVESSSSEYLFLTTQVEQDSLRPIAFSNSTQIDAKPYDSKITGSKFLSSGNIELVHKDIVLSEITALDIRHPATKLLKLLLDRKPEFGKSELVDFMKKATDELTHERVSKVIRHPDGTPLRKDEMPRLMSIAQKLLQETARKEAGLRKVAVEGEEEKKILAYPEQWMRVSTGATPSYPLPKVVQINSASLQAAAKQVAEKALQKPGPWSSDLYSNEELALHSRIPRPPSDFVIAVVRPDHILVTIEKLQSFGHMAITNDFPEVIIETTPIKLEESSGVFKYPVNSPRNPDIKFVLDPTNLHHPHPATLAHAVDIAWQREAIKGTSNAALVISNKMTVYSNDQMVFYPTIEELQQAGTKEITLMLDGVYEDDNLFPYLQEEQVTLSQVIEGKYPFGKEGPPSERLVAPFMADRLSGYLRQLNKAGINVNTVCLGDVGFEYKFWQEVEVIRNEIKRDEKLYGQHKIKFTDVLSDYIGRHCLASNFMSGKQISARAIQMREFMKAVIDIAVCNNDEFTLRFVREVLKVKRKDFKFLPMAQAERGKKSKIPPAIYSSISGPRLNERLRSVLIPLFDTKGNVSSFVSFNFGFYSVQEPKDNQEIYFKGKYYRYVLKHKVGCVYSLKLERRRGKKWVKVPDFSMEVAIYTGGYGSDPEGYERKFLAINRINPSGIQKEGSDFLLLLLKKLINNRIGNNDFLGLDIDGLIDSLLEKRKLLDEILKQLDIEHYKDTLTAEYDSEERGYRYYPNIKNQAIISFTFLRLAQKGNLDMIAKQITSRLSEQTVLDDVSKMLLRKCEKRRGRKSKDEAIFLNFYRTIYKLFTEILIGHPETREMFVKAFTLLKRDQKKQVIRYLKRIRDKEDYFDKSLAIEIIQILEPDHMLEGADTKTNPETASRMEYNFKVIASISQAA